MGLDNRAVTMRAAFDLAQIDIAIPEFSVPVLGKRPDHPKRGIPSEIVLPVDPLGLAGRTEPVNRHPGDIGHVLRPAETAAGKYRPAVVKLIVAIGVDQHRMGR